MSLQGEDEQQPSDGHAHAVPQPQDSSITNANQNDPHGHSGPAHGIGASQDSSATDPAEKRQNDTGVLNRMDNACIGPDDRNVDHNEAFQEAAPREPTAACASNESHSLVERGESHYDSAHALEHDKPNGDESGPEITTIMSQFKSRQAVSDEENAGLPVFQYPPRGSSLENRRASASASDISPAGLRRTDTGAFSVRSEVSEKTPTPSTISQPPPPEPDPEPDLPFDFHRFLEQLRHRSADPVAGFLKSFLHEFGKRQWAVNEQIKIVRDFLSFISRRMAQCEVWRTVSDAEFDNAQEGMEKLVMNRLYIQTFSPEIPPPPASKPKRLAISSSGTGRRGLHQEDVERDEVLAQKMRIYGWIKEDHLDIKPAQDAKSKKFLRLAQQELGKLQSYRAPRDKIICILNSCKVLFGYLRSAQAEQSADDFIPLLIYTVLKTAPDHIVSNVQYIQRFRNPDKLTGEAGYYMSSLLGAVAFIEGLDKTSLTISDEEYEKNVERAVASIAERKSREESRALSAVSLPFNEKSQLSRPEVTPRNSLDGEQISPRRRKARMDSSTGTAETSVGDESDDNAAVAGLLRTIQKPLSTIGRLFSDDAQAQSQQGPVRTPLPGSTPRMSPVPRGQRPELQSNNSALPSATATQQNQNSLAAAEAAARQASAESAEAQKLQRAEHQTVVETLSGMFPDLDREVIGDVVREKEGRVGLAVDACLALSR
ncbi:MAG: hypothetical protein Q9162_002674 [Coniocarpon cinnabarinum]